MTSYGQHMCGGTLVAPDVVLTAAHCRGYFDRALVGPYNRLDSTEDSEEFSALYPEYVHPLYDQDLYPYDFMLVKLSGSSTKPYIQLNDDPSLPTGNVDDELAVLGFGYTDFGDVTSEAFILQYADLNYVTNDVCDKAKDPYVSETYQGLITDDMMCAADTGQDSCQGDSGGPLIIQGSDSSQDVLVGVVSWGFECAHPSFPGIYARVSHELDWIKSTICQISRTPPEELDCDNHEYTPAPSPASTGPVTVTITLDDFPLETGWSITNKLTRQVLVDIPQETYLTPRSTVQETVLLSKGGTFEFQIRDAHGDGLGSTTPGNYIVSLGHNPGGAVLVSGEGNFGYTQTRDFVVPLEYDDPDDGTYVPIILDGQIPLTVQIQLDNYPQEIGWRVERLGLEVEEIMRVPPGIYNVPGMVVTQTLILDEGELYHFRIYDILDNGIDNGFFKLFLGATNTDDDSMLILDENGAFGMGMDFTFLASLAVGNNEPTPTPIPSDYYITLQLRLDLYPAEIGLQLRMGHTDTGTTTERTVTDTVIFFRPPRYYAEYSDVVIVEKIPIPRAAVGTTQEYTFIITDSYGDGLCCNNVGEVESGYSLYEGDPSDGIEISTSRFQASSREVTTFVLDAPDPLPTLTPVDEASIAPTAPRPTVDVVVTITLDEFPKETGFYIRDMAGTKVVDFPPGTYVDENTLVEEVVNLEIGVYTFAIIDSYDDGLNGDNAYYNVRLKDGGNRPALLTGSGLFPSEESQVFIVEGDRATHPLNIQFTTDSQPQEFGLTVKRLDLVGADALTASVPQGNYTVSDQSQTVSVMLEEGGLYMILFEDQGQNGIDSTITIVIGSPNDPSSRSFTVAGNEFEEKFQVKLFAGALPPTPSDAKTLELRVLMDRFPNEVGWILLSSASQVVDIKAFPEAEVIAYGPSQLYDQNLANTELVETIPLPGWSGERTLTMIITDEEGDGGMYTKCVHWCCTEHPPHSHFSLELFYSLL